MKFGLTQPEIEFIRARIIRPLAKLNARIWCFGSRARGDFKAFSDLDLMIESDQDLSSEISRIREEITESDFPYKIDLVMYSDFAESYKPSFEKDKVLFE